MLVSLIIFIIGFTMGGLNYVVTVLQGRARGMTLMRMPLTVWGIFTASVLALLAFPALFVASVMRSEEHTSELQSLIRISYAVFCLKKTSDTTYSMEVTAT